MISSSRKKTRLLHPHPLSGAGGRPSAVRQEIFLDVIAVGLEQHVGAAQLADLLFGALDHAVALARLRIEDLAGAGHFEALFSARFGLHLGHLALLMGGAGNRRPLRSMNDRVRDARAYLHLSMIFSENRYPLFGIMLLSTSPPPRPPLISRAAGARVMTEGAQICKFSSDNKRRAAARSARRNCRPSIKPDAYGSSER